MFSVSFLCQPQPTLNLKFQDFLPLKGELCSTLPFNSRYICRSTHTKPVHCIPFRLNIHPDVAGATFMAAGSSMPTMFISVTSVFLDEGDIGLGTIIGSTMFNILFITGICGVTTNVAINLKPYSIIRDSLCYVIYLAFPPACNV